MKGLDGVKFNCDENFAQTEKYVGTLVPVGNVRVHPHLDRPVLPAPGRAVRAPGARGPHRATATATSTSTRSAPPTRSASSTASSSTSASASRTSPRRWRSSPWTSSSTATPPFARTFVDAYVEASGDAELLRAARLLQDVPGLRPRQGQLVPGRRPAHPRGGARRRSAPPRSRYYELAAHYAAACNPQRLIVTCGLTGSGKSTLARKLGELYALQAGPLRRRAQGAARLAPVRAPAWCRSTRGSTPPSMTERTYAAMLERADAAAARSATRWCWTAASSGARSARQRSQAGAAAGRAVPAPGVPDQRGRDPRAARAARPEERRGLRRPLGDLPRAARGVRAARGDRAATSASCSTAPSPWRSCCTSWPPCSRPSGWTSPPRPGK